MAEDLLVGVEGDGGAAPVRRRADPLDRAQRQAARKTLLEKFAVAGDLHHHAVGKRVDHRGADAVQPARGLIGIARKLAAGVQRAQDHLQRRFAGEFRMRVDGDAAAVVADHHAEIAQQFDLDAAGMARHRLVHRVVQDLGDQVVQRAFVGAADIHAGPLAHRLQPLQHLDRGGRIAVGSLIRGGEEIVGHGTCSSCSSGARLSHAPWAGSKGKRPQDCRPQDARTGQADHSGARGRKARAG